MMSYSKLITVFTIGFGSTLLLTMMLYAVFLQFFIDNILNKIVSDDLAIASLIILSFVFIAFVSSFIVSILISTGIDKVKVMSMSVATYAFLFIFMLGFSVFIVWYIRPDLIESLHIEGANYIFVLPSICFFYFGVYILKNFMNLVLVIIVLYYLIFTSVLWIIERD